METLPTKLSDFAAPTEGGYGPRMKEIRMATPLSNTDVEVGNLFSVEYPEDRDGKETHVDLGKKFKCIFLRDAMTVGEYSSEENRVMYSSSEFRSYKQPVILFDHTMDKKRVHAVLPYSIPGPGKKGIKSIKEELKLKMGYVGYVLYKEEIYLLRMTITDMFGADSEDSPCIEKPSAKSYTSARAKCYEETPGQTFLNEIVVSSKAHSKKINLKEFTVKDRLPAEDEAMVTEKLHELYGQLSMILNRKFEKALEETPDLPDDMILSQDLINEIRENPLPLLNVGTYKLNHPQVVDAKAIEAGGESEVVDTVDAAKAAFPPSEEDIAKHEAEKASL